MILLLLAFICQRQQGSGLNAGRGLALLKQGCIHFAAKWLKPPEKAVLRFLSARARKERAQPIMPNFSSAVFFLGVKQFLFKLIYCTVLIYFYLFLRQGLKRKILEGGLFRPTGKIWERKARPPFRRERPTFFYQSFSSYSRLVRLEMVLFYPLCN